MTSSVTSSATSLIIFAGLKTVSCHSSEEGDNVILPVPVITANHGGMGEYVKDGINGLTHQHRDATDLRLKMEAAIKNPDDLSALGSKGYLFSDDGQIPSKEIHAVSIIEHYRRLLRQKMEVKE